MTDQEIQQKLDYLSAEIQQLKQEQKRKRKGYIATNISNQDELSFLYPVKRGNKWERSTIYADEFSSIRNAALNSVSKPSSVYPDYKDKFKKRKINDLSEFEHEIVIECAEELVSVVAKYKKKYLESIGRTDIVNAFGIK